MEEIKFDREKFIKNLQQKAKIIDELRDELAEVFAQEVEDLYDYLEYEEPEAYEVVQDACNIINSIDNLIDRIKRTQ